MPEFISFLTDFGLADDFVGTCHGVMKRIAPAVQIIDITHGIAPRQVLQGALTLANTLPYMPPGVHLAVVDPGVGGARRALALRDHEGRVHVGPVLHRHAGRSISTKRLSSVDGTSRKPAVRYARSARSFQRATQSRNIRGRHSRRA